MKKLLSLLFAAMLVFSLASCGKKGSLRTPTQMKSDAEKKARHDEKVAHEKAKEEEEQQEKSPDADNAGTLDTQPQNEQK